VSLYGRLIVLFTSIDDQKALALILLDPWTVFDTVDHYILQRRLEQVFGYKGLGANWVRSYLSQRKQYVSIRQPI